MKKQNYVIPLSEALDIRPENALLTSSPGDAGGPLNPLDPISFAPQSLDNTAF